MRPSASLTCLLALAVAACGSSDVAGGTTSSSASTPVTTIPSGVYRVRAGDTLTKIALAHCGERVDVLSIFEANQGRPQADGGALVEPDLIRVGWDLVIDCSATPGVFVPAPTAPGSTTTTTRPDAPSTTSPGPLQPDPLPGVTVKLGERASSAAPSPAVPDCALVTTLASLSPAVLRAGAAATTIGVTHGASLNLRLEGFGSAATLRMIDAAGRAKTERSTGDDEHYSIYIDPGLPPGEYRLEARRGAAVGTMGVRIDAATSLRFARRSSAALRYDVVGASGAPALTLHRYDTDSCRWVPWTGPASFDLDAGRGRLTIAVVTGASKGTYCLAVRPTSGAVDECASNLRRFDVT